MKRVEKHTSNQAARCHFGSVDCCRIGHPLFSPPHTVFHDLPAMFYQYDSFGVSSRQVTRSIKVTRLHLEHPGVFNSIGGMPPHAAP